MKLKYSFSVEQIISISSLLNKLYQVNFNSLSTQEKLEMSIGVDLSDLFEKKKRTLQKNLDLLTAHKKTVITLKFHEAWGLKNILIHHIGESESVFQQQTLQASIHLLDSKTTSKTNYETN